MATVALTLKEIEELARATLSKNGCDERNTEALTRTIVTAERDGSVSHGLFRLPGYVASLNSGKVKGDADPKVVRKTPAIISVDGDGGYAPLALEVGVPALADAATEIGVAVMAATNVHHFAALWPETEALAERGLIGMACVCYKRMVAPAGGKKALWGTNPISFAWPRPGKDPMVYDMATSAMAMGEIQVAARDGHAVPPGTGLGPNGEETTDPALIEKGVLLPFGGYKGSAIAMMVELLAAGAVGEQFSFEAHASDPPDGGPPRGGEFLLAMSPELMAGPGWEEHCESFFAEYEGMEGTRMPGARRDANRLDSGPRHINEALVEKIRSL